MPAYLIRHPRGLQREDVLVEDPALTLAFHGSWAVFSDAAGVYLAIPAADAQIERVDEAAEPEPQRE